MRASRRNPSKKSTTFTASIRNPATSKSSWMTLWSPTGSPSHPMRRSSTSSTRASPMVQTTRHISASSTSMSEPGRFRTAKCLPRCPNPALPTACAPIPKAISGARWAGAIRTRTASAATPSRRAARQDPHPGDCRQSVLRRHVPEPTLHLRLDIALCRLYQRDGRNKALIGQGYVLYGWSQIAGWLS